MIEEIGVTDDPKAIGYYSGFVEGVFALAQFCTGASHIIALGHTNDLWNLSMVLGLIV